MNGHVRLQVEWAVEGKTPGSNKDYGLLACSRGGLTPHDFTEIRSRYVTGTPKELPQITIGWVGGKEYTRLLLIIRRWSDQADSFGRRIAQTHYFSVLYSDLAEQRISYEGLYAALDAELDAERLVIDLANPESCDPLDIHVPVLDPGTLAKRVNDAAIRVAATLLSNRQLVVVGAESLPPLQRLRFLDVVTALLPYGLRTKLSASTWTSGITDHGIRLSFASTVPPKAQQVTWGDPVTVPYEGKAYYELLIEHGDRLTDVVAWLARDSELRSFSSDTARGAVGLLAGFGVALTTGTYDPWAGGLHTPGAIGDALRQCDELVRNQDIESLSRVLGHLELAVADRKGRFDPDEQARYREIVRDYRLLSPRPGLKNDVWDRLCSVVLRIAYGSVLTLEGLLHVLDHVDVVRPDLIQAMARMDTPDPYVCLYLATRLEDYRQAQAVERLSVDELARAAAQEPYDHLVIEAALDGLVRQGQRQQDGALAAALQSYGHLVVPVVFHFPDADQRLAKLRRLIEVAYGSNRDKPTFAKIVPFPPAPQDALLFAAAATWYGQGWGAAFLDPVIPFLRGSGVSKREIDRIGKEMLVKSQRAKEPIPAGRQIESVGKPPSFGQENPPSRQPSPEEVYQNLQPEKRSRRRLFTRVSLDAVVTTLLIVLVVVFLVGVVIWVLSVLSKGTSLQDPGVGSPRSFSAVATSAPPAGGILPPN
ncbi:hypothetical protein [Acrocarpospora catenulata]|uniref:hypothetical protein n=1 Tax=Acrocarpospora catenulata TaxID=2836182 RepID=UPI001BDA5E6B|nr:hypothetical protein [Acrocarpospora catenulata]